MKRSDQTDKIIGQRIGPGGTALYRLVSLLGQQTGRRTFLALDTRTQQKVVVKLLLFGPDFTWDDLKLFEREAETLRSLEHPAIPQYLDSFEVETLLGEGFALVQTYIEAKSLQAWVTGGYRFGEQELKIITGALLAILQYLHSRHPAVVHRDIKPSNVLLSEQMGHAPGRVYLVDFGSVQATSQGATMTVVGTYGYMPPEQFGGRAQPASDLYSLGATLIYLSSGQHPADLPQANMQIAFEAHTRFSPSFARWVRQLTYADLLQRPSSAAQALQQLRNLEYKTKQSDALRTHQEAEALPRKLPTSLSPRYNDFSLVSNTEKLEIVFPRFRVSGSFDANVPSRFPELILAISPTLLLLSYYLFGTIGLFWLVVILCLLAGRSRRVSRKHSLKDLARLSLWLPSGGALFLSLDCLSSVDDSDPLELQNRITNRNLPLTSSTVHSITVRGNNRCQLRFDFSHENKQGSGWVCLQGSEPEIRWLCDHLSQWKDVPVQWNR